MESERDRERERETGRRGEEEWEIHRQIEREKGEKEMCLICE